MSTEQIDTLIDRYLSHAMSEVERQSFETRLASDPELAKLVAAERLIQRTFSPPYSGRQATAANVMPAVPLLHYLDSSKPSRRLSLAALSGIALFTSVVSIAVYLTLSKGSQSPTSTVHVVDSARTITSSAPPDPITLQHPKTDSVSRPTPQMRPSRAVRHTQKTEEKLNERLGPPKVYARDTMNVKINTK